MRLSANVVSILFLLLAQTYVAYGETRICLTTHMSSADKGSTFYVTPEKLADCPKWIPGENLPLSLSDAVVIAKKWAQSKPAMSNCNLLNVKFSKASIVAGNEYRWFYDISFVDTSDPKQRAILRPVVVLLDGTIVEPENYK